MSKFNFSEIFKAAKKIASDHTPEILTGIGIAGMVVTTVLAVKGTPKAMELIEDKKEELDTEKLTPVEVVKTTWKCYIPATVMGVASIGCLVGASSVNLRRNAALATAYKLSETALMEYKEKVVETIGEKKNAAIEEQVDQEKIKKHPIGNSGVIITGRGTTLCLDANFGTYFESDIESIKKAINEVNRQMLVNDYVSVNDLYDELGLEHINVGDDLGWRIDGGYIEPRFTTDLTPDGRPCLVLNYDVKPKQNFSRYN